MPGHKYSKNEILKMLNNSGIKVSDKAKNFVGFYDDGKDDLLERAYIWNTTGYKLMMKLFLVLLVQENAI